MHPRSRTPAGGWRGRDWHPGAWNRGEWNHGEWPPPWWDPERDSHRFKRRSSAGFRLWAPVIISLLLQVPNVFVAWTQGRGPTRVEFESPLVALLALGLALVGPLALIGARRFPGPVVVIVGIAASVDLLLAGDDGPPYIALAFAIGSAIVRGARVWAWATIAGTWVGSVIAGSIMGLDWHPLRIVGITFGILVLVGFAEGLRTQRERIEEATRRVAARRQSEVQAERVRIARELHDVLAHSLSQINVQAGVGLHLIDKNPEKARDALAAIKDTSKVALDEVRSVLGILRDGTTDAPLVPEPDLSRLEGLVASVTAQGIDVQLEDSLTEVPKPTQLALYRIAQESLTNVVRHSQATRATVTLAEDAGSYRLVVSDNGTPSTTASEGGRGLLGMRERAELLGGSLEAGPSPRGGFTVTATIPRMAQP
jgi:signal transduction histidine kinase